FYLPEMEGFRATERLLGSFDVDHIEPETLLFQAGYLTVKRCESTLRGVVYHLSYPNKEVKVSLNEHLFAYFTRMRGAEEEEIRSRLEEVLRQGRVEEFKEILRSLFASIPYEWYRKNNLSEYEGYYASVVYSFLAGTGLEMVAEEYTSKGRVDLVVRVDEKVYVIEFKVMEGGKAKALEELKRKGYVEKYRGQGREVYLVGIDFDAEERNIKAFEWERV
ncbi:MAG: PD-(D/E)XK nuclease domain-containing protein, partial [Thermofilaceae archaeon]